MEKDDYLAVALQHIVSAILVMKEIDMAQRDDLTAIVASLRTAADGAIALIAGGGNTSGNDPVVATAITNIGSVVADLNKAVGTPVSPPTPPASQIGAF